MDEKGPGRVYFGEEACERRIPSAGSYAEAVRELKKRKNEVTLVFPPLTDKGIAKAGAVLEALQDEEGLECVVNDYGLLDLANRKGPPMSFVIGRLLSRVLTQNILDLHAYDREECVRFCDSLRERNVGRFDFDLFNLGLLKSDIAALPFPMSLFTPLDIVAFTRRCTIAGCSTAENTPFPACKQECRDLSFDLGHSYLEGAYFIYENLVLAHARTPKGLNRKFDRVVRWRPPQLTIARKGG